MIRQFSRYLKQWLAYRKLNKLVTRSRARSEQYSKRREAAKAGWERRRAA